GPPPESRQSSKTPTTAAPPRAPALSHCLDATNGKGASRAAGRSHGSCSDLVHSANRFVAQRAGGRSSVGCWLYCSDRPGGMLRYVHWSPRADLAAYTICPTW